MRRAAKRDSAEKAIVDALRACGWSVEYLNIDGGPDLLLGKGGETHLVECKTGNKKVRPNQQDWHERWRGSPVLVIRTAAQAVSLSRGIRDYFVLLETANKKV